VLLFLLFYLDLKIIRGSTASLNGENDESEGDIMYISIGYVKTEIYLCAFVGLLKKET
jgi:hypothetical protein